MQRKTTISLLLCIGAIVSAMTLLYWTSPLGVELEPAGFNRKFANVTAVEESSLELDDKYLYIAGFDSLNIYVGHYYMPYLLTKCDLNLEKSEQIKLKMHKVDSVKDAKRFKTIIAPPFFFMANGVMPTVLRGKIGNWIAEPFIPYDEYYFSELAPISKSSFALCSFSNYQNGLQLAKLTEIDTPHFNFNFNLLKQQQDGLFSVNGRLLSYKQENKIVYVYTYRNQYLIIDSDMKSHQIKNTIDTFSIAPIRVSSYNNNSQHTLSSPQIIINGSSCIDENYLYIKSTLLAKNEDIELFMKSSTIDVYDLKKGEYSFSFHIPQSKQKGFSEFRIKNNKIYTIYNERITTYKLSK